MVMALVSTITLCQLFSSKQAKLFATISIHSIINNKGQVKRFWCLDISNIGLSVAYNIKLRMDKSFIKSLPIKSERKILKDLIGRRFVINPN